MGRLKMAMRGATAAAAAFVCAAAMAAGGPPDFTGVWTSADGASGRPGGNAVQAPPMKPEARRRHDAFNELVGPTGDTPGGVCLGAGMPAVLLGAGGYPMEIIQRPGQVTMIFELHGEIRRIYIGERNMPEADRVPGRNGYSSGRWEGDTLVVETDNLVEQLDQRSTPHSATATIVERFRLDGKDAQGRRVLVADVTMNDPEFYTAPVVFTRRWAEVPDGHLLPYECNEELWFDRIESLAKKAGVGIP